MSAELKKLAEDARRPANNEQAAWYEEKHMLDGFYPKNARFIAAASPDAILKILAERDALYAFAMRVC